MTDFNLLIDGKLVPGDLTMPVLNPATEEVLAQCPRASNAQLDTAVAAAKAAFPGWAATPIEERRKLIVEMADAIEANVTELARLLTSRTGQAAGGRDRRSHGHGRLLPLSRLARPADEGRSRTWATAASKPIAARSASSAHHPVELSAADPQLQAAAGTAGRQHAGREAGADHAAVDAEICRTGQGHPAQGRAQRHHRCQRSRRRHDQPPRHPQDLVHRIDRDRTEGDGQRRRDPEADHAGTGRQRRQHRARRRRPEEGRARHFRRCVPEQRTGLPRHQAALCS